MRLLAVMSKSFFEAAIFLNQTKNYQDNKIKKLILTEYFLDQQNLTVLKEAMSNRRLDGSYCGHKDDEKVIEEYLSSLSNQKLNELLQGLKLKTIDSFYGFPKVLKVFIKTLVPIINAYYLFKCSGGLLGFLSNYLDSKKVSKDPYIELTTKEEKLCSEYSQLFKEAAKGNKKYNKLYRDLIGTTDFSEQVLSGLLYYLKSLDLSDEYQTFEASDMLFKIEKHLLNGKKISDQGIMDELEVTIKDKLAKAYISVNKNEDFDSYSHQSKINKIYNAVNLFKDILTKIINKEQQLEKAPLTKIELNKITNFVLNYKRKILHFIIRTDAFVKEETLNPGVRLNDPYFTQGVQYSTYLDFWLSKVPEKNVNTENCDLSHGIVKKLIFDPNLIQNQTIFKKFFKEDLAPNIASISYDKLRL